MQWISDNKEWIFSGAGLFVLTALVAIFKKSGHTTSQTQKSGKNSTNYQSAGGMQIGDINLTMAATSPKEIAAAVVNEMSSDPLATVASCHNMPKEKLVALLCDYANALAGEGSLEESRALLASGKLQEAVELSEQLTARIKPLRTGVQEKAHDFCVQEAEAFRIHGIASLRLGNLISATHAFASAADLLDKSIDCQLWTKTQKHLAMAHFAAGDYAKALGIYMAALPSDYLKTPAPEKFEDYFTLAQILLPLNQTKKAVAFCGIALHLAQSNFARSDDRLAAILHTVAEVHLATEDYPQAEVFARKHLGLLRENEKLDRAVAVVGFYTLAKILRLTGRQTEAFDLYEKALDVSMKKLGPEHSFTAMTINDIGLCYLETDEPETALSKFRAALDIESQHRPNTIGHSSYLANCGRALLLLQRKPEAKDQLNAALAIRKRILPPGCDMIRDIEKILSQMDRPNS